jgi:autotransporter-associated beta strand protein
LGTLTGNIYLASPSTIGAEGIHNGLLGGVISGNGPLTKTGTGSVQLGGGSGAANTYTGDTLVHEGTLVLFKPAFIQAVPGNLVIGSGGFFATPATARHFSPDQIWGSVTVNAGSLLDVNGYEEYLLTLALNGGGDAQTGGGLLTLLAGNSLEVDPGPPGNNTATISGRLGLRVGDHRISVGGFNLPPPGGAPELDIPATVEFVDGLANLHKHGSGTMRLRGANTFTGTLNVNDGRVIAAHNSALGTTQASTLVQTNGALALDGGITTGELLILDSAASPALVSSSGSNVVNNGINLLQPASGIEVQPANGYLQVLGRVGSSGGLTKLGPGTLQFWGATSNTYGGLTTVSAGVLQAGRSNAVSIPGDAIIGDDSTTNTTATLRLLRDTQLKRSASVAVNASGLLDLSPPPGWPAPQPTLRRLCNEGRVNLASLTSLTLSNDVDSLCAGSITGYGSVNKYGPATFQMTGDSPFYGWTTVNEGYYRMHGRATNSPVVVKPGATLNGEVAVDGTYSNVSELPVIVGGRYALTNSAANTNQFYRLIHP